MTQALVQSCKMAWGETREFGLISQTVRLGRRAMDHKNTQPTTSQAMLPPESIQIRLRNIKSALAVIRRQGDFEVPPRKCRFRKSRPCYRA